MLLLKKCDFFIQIIIIMAAVGQIFKVMLQAEALKNTKIQS